MAKICIVGTDSIGYHLGGRLLAAGVDVPLVGRTHIGSELSTRGLTLTGHRNGRWYMAPAEVRYMAKPGNAADADLVLVTVKSAATQAVADELKPVLRAGVIVTSSQNGLRNVDLLRATLPQQIVLAGIVPFNVMQPNPGAFRRGMAGELEMVVSSVLQPFLDDFLRAGLPLTEYTDMVAVQWAKLLLNLNNAINTSVNRSLKEELSQRAYRRYLVLAQTEVLRLPSSVGIQPTKLTPIPSTWIPRLFAIPDAVFARLGDKMFAMDPLARSPISDDLVTGRTTEVDWVNGKMVRLAKCLEQRASVDAYLCAMMYAAESIGTHLSWFGNGLSAALCAAGQSAPASPTSNNSTMS